MATEDAQSNAASYFIYKKQLVMSWYCENGTLMGHHVSEILGFSLTTALVVICEVLPFTVPPVSHLPILVVGGELSFLTKNL